MFSVSDRARRYYDRAEECLRIAASSQTLETAGIYREIAIHYLELAASEKFKASGPSELSA
jgi:hypothetical protein